jgi:hypothetical protein
MNALGKGDMFGENMGLRRGTVHGRSGAVLTNDKAAPNRSALNLELKYD